MEFWTLPEKGKEFPFLQLTDQIQVTFKYLEILPVQLKQNTNIKNYWVSKKKFRRLEGCGIKSMWPIFKTKKFIYQSKINLDEKILFGKIKHL